MITVKLKDIVDSVNVMQMLSQRDDLGSRVSYNIGKILRCVETEFNAFEKIKQQLLHRYGEKDENDQLKVDTERNEYILTPNNAEKFKRELNDALEIEVSVNANKIKLEDLDKCNIAPASMALLVPFIEE